MRPGILGTLTTLHWPLSNTLTLRENLTAVKERKKGRRWARTGMGWLLLCSCPDWTSSERWKYLTLHQLRQWSVCLQCGRPGFHPWVRKVSWRRKWQPTPVFSHGKSHGQRSLVGYSPWDREESDATERLHFLSFYTKFNLKFLSSTEEASKLLLWDSMI